MDFETLPGFRVFQPNKCFIRNYIFDRWKKSASSFGFEQFDSPVLEPLNLYKEKSGEEIVKQLFDFKDKGDREVALRPEMTPSLARIVGANANSLKKPIKWFSIGEQFRYERPQKGRLRSFYQFNVDILGEPSINADAEVIACLTSTLMSFGLGLKDFKVHLSDRKLWMLFLQKWNVKQDNVSSILSIIDRKDRLSENEIVDKLKFYFKDEVDYFILELNELLRLDSFEKLNSFFLNTSDSFSEKNDLVARLEQWSRLFNSIKSLGYSDFVKIDFNIVRGLNYYTGLVFEVFDTSKKRRAIAGGGRYDNLVKKISGNNLEAVGFAIGDVTLMDLLDNKNKLPLYNKKLDIMFVFCEEVVPPVILTLIRELRDNGYEVNYPLGKISISKQFKYIEKIDVKYAFIYDKSISDHQILVKDLIKNKDLNLDLKKSELVQTFVSKFS